MGAAEQNSARACVCLRLFELFFFAVQVASSHFVSLHSTMAIRCIKAVSIMDLDGRRVCAKYFDPKLAKDEQQRQFEAKIFAKTKNMVADLYAEVIMLDKNIVVFRSCADVLFYVIGVEEGNELIYNAVLDGLYEVRACVRACVLYGNSRVPCTLCERLWTGCTKCVRSLVACVHVLQRKRVVGGGVGVLGGAVLVTTTNQPTN